MNKLLLITLFTFLSLTQCLEPAKDFLVAFFKKAQNVDIDMTQYENCFGEKFDSNLRDVIDYYRAKEIVKMNILLFQMLDDIISSCPIDQFKNLGQEIVSKIQDKSFFENFSSKIIQAYTIILKEVQSPEHSGTSIGEATGSAISVFLNNFQQYLRGNRKALKLNTFGIIQGFIRGMQRTSKTTKCSEDANENKDAILKIIREIFIDLIKGKKINEALLSALEKLSTMEALMTDCRVLEFIEAVKFTKTEEGKAKVRLQIHENILELMPNTYHIFDSIYYQDADLFGFSLGNVTRILLAFTVY